MNLYVVCLENGGFTIVNMHKDKLHNIKGAVCAYGPYSGKGAETRTNWLVMTIRSYRKRGKEFPKEPSIVFKRKRKKEKF